MDAAPSEHALDACSLLNVIASRRFADIAPALPEHVIVAREAASEISYVRRGGTGPDADDRDPIDLQALAREGLLSIVALATPSELADLVAFAVEMDDGEAATGALAISRKAIVVTDDRKARRAFGARNPALALRTTSEVVKAWADRTNPSAEELASVLSNIETRARFGPGASDPLSVWWTRARGT